METTTCIWRISSPISRRTSGWSLCMRTVTLGHARPSLMSPAPGSFPATAPSPNTRLTSGRRNPAPCHEATGRALEVRHLAAALVSTSCLVFLRDLDILSFVNRYLLLCFEFSAPLSPALGEGLGGERDTVMSRPAPLLRWALLGYRKDERHGNLSARR